MQISKRLLAAIKFVTVGNRVADIGCDHAYTAIYLMKNSIATHVVACDINKGPLARAKENIERFGLSKEIETRLSNGVEKIVPGEVDTLFISGMGGELVTTILSEGREVVEKCKELVLQPQSEVFLVRKYLQKIGYVITNEDMLIEDGKYYVIMRAENAKLSGLYTQDMEGYTETFYRYGRLLLEEGNEVLYEFLKKEKATYERIKEGLKKSSSETTLQRKAEVQRQLTYIEEGLKYYER